MASDHLTDGSEVRNEMATELKRLDRSPTSSGWRFRGSKNGYDFWVATSGKLFASFQTPNGKVWYQVVPKKG